MSSARSAALICYFSVVALLFSACGGLEPLAEPQVQSEPLAPTDSLWQAYRAAIEDAQTAEPDEIYRYLTPIVPYNTQLIWMDEPGESAVLVATWTDSAPGEASPGETVRTEGETWITVAPELAEFCGALNKTDDALHQRMAQVLGLPPDVTYDRIVEIWVDPEDVFRPCPDPQITDSQCELDTPRPSQFLQVSESHQQWMAAQEDASYREDGYPWTRLGYTYDWGDPNGNIGLSEYVITLDAEITIHAIESTEAYCR